MRWKLLRRRYSISSPRMIVRSHLPWPLRWMVVALMLGLSAAVGLWAFEFGKSIAGLDQHSELELAQLRVEVAQLRAERETVRSIANTAESLLKTEKAVQEKLALEVKQVELENLSLKADLGFFEKLLPAGGHDGLSMRALRAHREAPGQLRFQALIMQIGKTVPEFVGRYEVVLAGTLDGKPWLQAQSGGPKVLQVKQSLRLDETIDYPERAVVKSLQIKLTDGQGQVKASQGFKF